MIFFRDTNVPFVESPFHLLFRKRRGGSSVSEGVVVRFIKDLSILVNAGVPLVKSLEVLARQQRDEVFGVIVRDLSLSVYSGMALSVSLMKYPRLFDVLFVSMVRAGEVSCNLGEVLERIARHREKEMRLRKKIKSIMIYPLVVVSIATIIVSLLFLFIIPKFETVFSTAFSETVLPLSTRMIILVSHLFQEISIFLIVAMVILFLIVRFMKKGAKDKMILKIPIIGSVVKDVNVALFSRILGTLTGNGVPLIEALRVSENVATNQAIRSSLKKVRGEVEDGEALSSVIQSEGLFSELVMGMIQVGEETATLSSMMLEVANKLEEDIELAIQGLTSLLEPLMTLMLAVVIGSIVIALFLPIVNVMNNIMAF